MPDLAILVAPAVPTFDSYSDPPNIKVVFDQPVIYYGGPLGLYDVTQADLLTFSAVVPGADPKHWTLTPDEGGFQLNDQLCVIQPNAVGFRTYLGGLIQGGIYNTDLP